MLVKKISFKKVFAVSLLAIALVFSVGHLAPAHAASGTFGFESVIQKFTETLKGDTAQNICIAAIIVCALALIFQPDMQAWMKTMVAIVLIAACIAKATAFVQAIFGA